MADEPQAPPHGPLERKLVTILSADVAEYSRLMAEDEEHTLRVFREYSEIFSALVDSHHGRIFNTAGDAILAEFTSPVEAVRCATDIQAALRSRNDLLPANRQVRFRIGVNLGDVMMQKTDLMGDGVNVAARLQGAAEPGGITVSGSVYDQIRNKLSLSFESLGERRYKNIPQPVRTFAIAGTDSSTADEKPAAKKPGGLVWAGVAAAVVLLLAGGYWAMHQRGAATNEAATNVPPAAQAPAGGTATANIAPPPAEAKADISVDGEASALLADAVRIHRPQAEIQALSDANTKIAALAAQLHGLAPGNAQAGALTAQMNSLATGMAQGEMTALAAASNAMGRATKSGADAMAAADARSKFDELVASAGQTQDGAAALGAARQAIASFETFSAVLAVASPAPARRVEAVDQDAPDDEGNIPTAIHDQIAQAKSADAACIDAIKADPGAASGDTCSRRDSLIDSLKSKGWCGRPRGDTGVRVIWNQCQ